MDKTFYTLDEVRQQLGLHINTLYKAIQTGQLEAYNLGEGYRCTPEAVNAYIESKKVRPTLKVK